MSASGLTLLESNADGNPSMLNSYLLDPTGGELTLNWSNLCGDQCKFPSNEADSTFCFEKDKLNGSCESKCQNLECDQDVADCSDVCKMTLHQGKMVGDPCSSKQIGDGVCQSQCYNSECNMDLGDCGTECASGCAVNLIGNKKCEPACYNINCNLDSLRGPKNSDCADKQKVGQCLLGAVQSNGTCDMQCFNDQEADEGENVLYSNYDRKGTNNLGDCCDRAGCQTKEYSSTDISGLLEG